METRESVQNFGPSPKKSKNPMATLVGPNNWKGRAGPFFFLLGLKFFFSPRTDYVKLQKSPKITLKNHVLGCTAAGKARAVQQDFCQHPRDVADMWLDYCS